MFSAALCLIAVLPTSSADTYSLQTNREPGSVEGKVCTASGEPISGVQIALASEHNEKKNQTTTNVDGTFALFELEPGTYTLRPVKIGWKPTMADSVIVRSGEKKHIDIVLEPVSSSGAAFQKNENGNPVDLKFSDEPNFAVAGVTDWSSAGLHGSAVNARTSEALAKETAALKPSPTAKSPNTTEADNHRLLGDAKERAGDPIAAVNEYERAARMDPSEENYFAWGAELLLHRASAAAIEVFSKGAKEHANSARMLAALGAAYYASGQYSEAAQRICQSSDLQPLNPEPYLLLGKIEQSSPESLPCSAEKLSRFLQHEPGNAQANYYYGLVLWKTARKSQSDTMLLRAEESFKKAVTIDPRFGEAYVQLGLAIAARGHLQEAQQTFEKATQANPKLGIAHYQLSLAYRRAAEIEKADRELSTYKEIERTEKAQEENQRRELRQFVTILKGGTGSAKPH
jgi:tetratricopeptide (TPR) repeat protein